MWLRHSQETAAVPGSGARRARTELVLEYQLPLFIHSSSELRVQFRAGGGGRGRTGGCVIHYRKKAKKERKMRAASRTGRWLCRNQMSPGLGPETVRKHRAGGGGACLLQLCGRRDLETEMLGRSAQLSAAVPEKPVLGSCLAAPGTWRQVQSPSLLPSPLLCGSPEPTGPQTRGEIMAFAARAEEMGKGATGMLRGGSGARLGEGGVEEGFLEEVTAKSSEISTV